MGFLDVFKRDSSLDKQKLELSNVVKSSEAKELLQKGYFVKENFVNTDKVDKILNNLMNILKNYETTPGRIEIGNGSFMDIRGYDKNVDVGKIDWFHIDKIIDVSDVDIDYIKNILFEINSQLELKNFNSYIDKGVTTARGFHSDSYGVFHYKAFIYLTDVDDLSFGPYTYIENSHIATYYRLLNQIKNSILDNERTDITIYNKNLIRPMIAKKGTLVISDQTGFHRGWPQEKDKFRAILTMNFAPKNFDVGY
jgi:hypothetical protein